MISAGTSVRESVDLIQANGAIACGVSIALDRQEKGLGELSATQEVEQNNNMPVISIAKLSDLLAHIESSDALTPHLEAIKRYQQRYCLTT